MGRSFEEFLVGLAFMGLFVILTELLSSKLKMKYMHAFVAVFGLLLIFIGCFFLITGDVGYMYGVSPVPPFGQVVTIAGGVAMLVIVLRHWRKERKNPTPVDSLEDEGDANTDVEKLEHTHAAENAVDDTPGDKKE